MTKDGIMFASHCSPLSNLSKCRITEEDVVYQSAEQRIVHKLCEDYIVATKVFFVENPYKIKNLAKAIKKTDEWIKKKK